MNKKYYFVQFLKMVLILFVFTKTNITLAQTGCTDARANNYNSVAVINDGSCTYNYTLVTPTVVCFLDNTVAETSGLIQINNTWFTHNDSYNKPLIYGINNDSCKVIQTIKMDSATNTDWEAITSSTTNLYIADIGNNDGTRQDLKIYKTNQIPSNTDTVLANTIINYSYSNQTIFTSNSNTNFDAEACLFVNDSLYIFTKQWGNNKTTYYKLPTVAGNYIIDAVDSFNVNGLITDAAISPNKKTIALLGYDANGNGFVWLLWDFKNNNLFSGNKRRLDFGITLGQAEGICFYTNDSLYITNEKFSIFPALLQKTEVGKYVNALPNMGNNLNKGVAFTIVNNVLVTEEKNYNVYIFNTMGNLHYFNSNCNGNHSLQQLHNGIYFVQVCNNKGCKTKVFNKN